MIKCNQKNENLLKKVLDKSDWCGIISVTAKNKRLLIQLARDLYIHVVDSKRELFS
jgi:hypothetical protein